MHETRVETLNPRQRALAEDDPASHLHSKINSGPEQWSFFIHE